MFKKMQSLIVASFLNTVNDIEQHNNVRSEFIEYSENKCGKYCHENCDYC